MKKVELTEREVLGILGELIGFSAGLLVYSYLMSSTVSKNLFWEIIRRFGIAGICIAVDHAVTSSINENLNANLKDATVLCVNED